MIMSDINFDEMWNFVFTELDVQLLFEINKGLSLKNLPFVVEIRCSDIDAEIVKSAHESGEIDDLLVRYLFEQLSVKHPNIKKEEVGHYFYEIWRNDKKLVELKDYNVDIIEEKDVSPSVNVVEEKLKEKHDLKIPGVVDIASVFTCSDIDALMNKFYPQGVQVNDLDRAIYVREMLNLLSGVVKGNDKYYEYIIKYTQQIISFEK